MKTSKRYLSLVMVASLVMTLALQANTLRIDRVSGYYSGGGGEFTLVPTDSGDLNPIVGDYHPSATHTYTSGPMQGLTGIQSFCVEIGETLSIPNEYNYKLNTGAIKGGMAVIDTVSVGSGFIYSQFAQGSLPGYDYSPGSGRSASAAVLQEAVWFFEGEISLPNPLSNPFITAAASEFGSVANSQLDSFFDGVNLVKAVDYGVGAINMGPAPTYPRQDQLFWTEGGFKVPDGGTSMILLGLALSSFALMRRSIPKQA